MREKVAWRAGIFALGSPLGTAFSRLGERSSPKVPGARAAPEGTACRSGRPAALSTTCGGLSTVRWHSLRRLRRSQLHVVYTAHPRTRARGSSCRPACTPPVTHLRKKPVPRLSPFFNHLQPSAVARHPASSRRDANLNAEERTQSAYGSPHRPIAPSPARPPWGRLATLATTGRLLIGLPERSSPAHWLRMSGKR